jgi:hypothetical protein
VGQGSRRRGQRRGAQAAEPRGLVQQLAAARAGQVAGGPPGRVGGPHAAALRGRRAAERGAQP